MAAHVVGHAKGGRSLAGATSTHSPQSSEASMPAGLSKAEVPTYEIRPSQQGQGMSSFGMSSALALAGGAVVAIHLGDIQRHAELDVQMTLAEARSPLTLGCGGVALSWQTDRQTVVSHSRGEMCSRDEVCIQRDYTYACRTASTCSCRTPTARGRACLRLTLTRRPKWGCRTWA